MIKIKHQLITKDFFIPQWKTEHLFLGTFNPEGGELVPYFYGRQKNFTWKILNEIFTDEFRNSDSSLPADFFQKLKNKGVACMDMIRSVEISDQDANHVMGKGYSDSKIINNKVVRVYNTLEINKVITANPGIRVYSTWGTGSRLSDWKKQLSMIESPIISLRSPSPVARVPKVTEKYPYVLEDWRAKIILEL